METVVLEALGVAGFAALAIAMRRAPSSAPRRTPSALSPRRFIRALPRRHRRAARAIADLASECLARHSEGSFEGFTAAETLREYLPQTIGAFLAVPPGYRRRRPAGRPSADDQLLRQFDTLYFGLARIIEADAATGASRLAANGAFLDERFGPAPQRLAPEHRVRRDLRAIFNDRLSGFLRR